MTRNAEDLSMGSGSDVSPSTGTSPSLLAGVHAGENTAWERLVKCYSPRIAQWCHSKGLDDFATADVTQETLISVAKSLGRFESETGVGAFRAWLWRIVQRRIADYRRHQTRQPLALGGSSMMTTMSDLVDHAACDSSSTGTSKGTPRFKSLLHRIESNFEPKTWQVFLRSVVDQVPTDAVAAEFQMTSAGVRQIRSRVLRHLRRAIDSKGKDLF